MATLQNSEVMPHKLKVHNVCTVVINRILKGLIMTMMMMIIIIVIIIIIIIQNNKLHGETRQEIPRILRNVTVH